MRQSPVVFGVTVLALGILSVVPGICAIEASEVDANSKAIQILSLLIRAFPSACLCRVARI